MTITIGVLSKNRFFYPTEELLNELRVRDDVQGFYLDTQLVSPFINENLDAFILDYSLKTLNCVIPRIGRSSTEFGIIFLRQLELMGIPTTLTSEALSNARNKFQCYQLLKKIKGVQVPKTVLIQDSRSLERLLPKFKFPAVLKVVNSTQGMGTILVPNSRLTREIISTIFLSNQSSIMLQEYLAPVTTDKNKGLCEDIRVFIVGDQVIGAMRRTANKGEWRTNYALGASVTPYKLEPSEEELALRISEKIGIEITGIDFLKTSKGPVVLEVNACPGWKALQQVNPLPKIAEVIVDYAIKKIKQ